MTVNASGIFTSFTVSKWFLMAHQPGTTCAGARQGAVQLRGSEVYAHVPKVMPLKAMT